MTSKKAKAVTTAQLEATRKMAQDKGITSSMFQEHGIDGGIIGQALDKIKARATHVKTSKLLKLICSVAVPAVSKFVASEAFGENNSAGIKFWLNEDFRNNFLGKIELNVPAGELNIHELTKASKDAPIRKELTPEFEETKLAHFYELLKDKLGWFVAYIYDDKGNLWAVYAFCLASIREWDVWADSVTSPFGRDVGGQVVSRKLA